MPRRSKARTFKKTKGIIEAAAACFVVAGAALLWRQQTKTSELTVETTYDITAVTEGTISLSTLLIGTVKAFQEQYVYYDNSKGTEARPTVSVGNQITVG